MFSTTRFHLLPLMLAATASAAAAQWNYVERAAFDSTAQFGSGSAFGHRVDLDGDTAVVGVPNPVAGSGHVIVYRLVAGIWTQEADLVAVDTVPSNFGFSLALDGDTLVVGADNRFQNFTSTGAAYVFERSGTSWTQTQMLLPPGAPAQVEFGSSVGISGSTLVVGAPHTSITGQTNRGAAYVYERSGGTWTQTAQLYGSDTTWWEENGASVAIENDLIVVGAPFHTYDLYSVPVPTWYCGAGYVFRRSGGTWLEEAKLLASSPLYQGYLGTSAAIDGNRIVLGASGENTATGAAYVFEQAGAAWVEKQRLTGAGGAINEWFGTDVDVDGNLIVVGAWRYDNPLPTGLGTVKLFSFDGAAWSERFDLLGGAMGTDDTLGTGVAIQGDLVIGGSGAYLGGVGKAWIWEVVPSAVEVYCVSKVSAQGCVPAIGWSGLPSASSPAAFLVTAGQVPGQKGGLMLYGFEPAAIPFYGGTLCIRPPVKRTPNQTSGSSPATCSGTYSFDLNALIQSGSSPALVAGEDVYCQYWHRDPLSPQAAGTSDALRARIQP